MGRRVSNFKKSIYVNVSRRYQFHKEKDASPFSCFWHSSCQLVFSCCTVFPAGQSIYLVSAWLLYKKIGICIKMVRQQLSKQLPPCAGGRVWPSTGVAIVWSEEGFLSLLRAEADPKQSPFLNSFIQLLALQFHSPAQTLGDSIDDSLSLIPQMLSASKSSLFFPVFISHSDLPIT